MRRDNFDPENAAESERSTHTPDYEGQSTTGSSGSGSDIQRQAGEVADKAQQQAVAVKDKAVEQAEVGKQKAASGLHTAAEQMRTRSEGQDGTRGQVMSKAAETMDKSAQYLEEHEPREMWDDLERFVREHPMQAAAGALVAGLIVGRILR